MLLKNILFLNNKQILILRIVETNNLINCIEMHGEESIIFHQFYIA